MVDQPASFHTPIHSAIMKATHLPEIFNTPLQISKTTKYRSKTRVRIIPKQLKTHQFLHCSFSYVLIRINIGIIGKTKEECRADIYVASLSTKSEILTRDFCLFFAVVTCLMTRNVYRMNRMFLLQQNLLYTQRVFCIIIYLDTSEESKLLRKRLRWLMEVLDELNFKKIHVQIFMIEV